MSLYDSRSFFYADNKRSTMFPSLRKNIEARGFRPKELLGLSVDDKDYRKTSNLMLKGLIKQNNTEIKQLRSTFLNQSCEGQNRKKIGQYQIVKEIGKGGFAQVYEVIDEKGQRLALKEYNLQNALECYHNQSTIGDFFFDKGTIRKNFQSRDGSGHLIKFIDKFRQGKYGYIVQELADHSFSKMLSDIQGVFHNNERVYQVRFKDFYRQLASHNYLKKMMTELCKVILLINEQGFIHCDLKLENLMIQFQGDEPKLKVIDFGSTFQIKYGLPKITITPQYMPPELLIMLENGSNDYDILKKVDVWSIGCILLQIVTGMPLWFRYKCKVEVRGKPMLQMSIFSLANRDYSKIVKKQRQLVDSLGRLQFTMKQFDKFRPILKKLLVLNPVKRATLQDCISQLNYLQ